MYCVVFWSLQLLNRSRTKYYLDTAFLGESKSRVVTATSWYGSSADLLRSMPWKYHYLKSSVEQAWGMP
eukprot:jgi/Botrbrau1/15677/Bobra.4_1s0056.1